MKEWRKLSWSGSRAMLQLRISELGFIGVSVMKEYFYKVAPEKDGKLTVMFRERKKSVVGV